jgi:hypothetical protein
MGDFIARQNAWILKVYAVLSVLPALVNLYYLPEAIEKRLFWPIVLAIFFSASTIYLWFLVLDKRKKLIITKEGIWSKKYKLLPWETVVGYFFERRWGGKILTTFLFIDTTAGGEPLKIEITYLDKSPGEISDAIQRSSAGFKIETTGIHNYKV